MYLRSVVIIILVAFTGFSCSKITYLQAPLTLDESIGQQNVLVKTTKGKNLKFDYIIENSGSYRGIKGSSFVPLTTESVEAVYLRLDKINSATILLSNNTKIEGFLLEVTDSSVVIAFSDRSMPHANSLIQDIKKIKIRKNGGVRKGYLIGTGIGIGAGLAISTAAVVTSGGGSGAGFAIFAVAGTLGALGSIVGLTAGSIAGTKNFKINGSIDTFNTYKMDLQALSFRSINNPKK